jgi:hypothetical protein
MNDLWGDLPDAANLQSPEDILQEQAALLREKTGGKLVGVVEPVERESWGGRSISRPDFEYVFLIRAPLLNDYTYTICQVSHGISFYPVWVECSDPEDHEECPDMDAFAAAIGRILRGDRVRGVVATLLKQTNSRAAGRHPPGPPRTAPPRRSSPAPTEPDDDLPF